MTATYTFDVFATLDGFASYNEDGDWGGYWGKQGPEFLARREEQLNQDQRLVLGATTYGQFVEALGPSVAEAQVDDPVNLRMMSLPTTVISSTRKVPLEWSNATLESGDAAEIVARLKAESDLPLRSHGSLSLNRSLLAAGLVDRIQISVMPVVSGRTGAQPVFANAADFDLELIEARTLDGRIQELTYRPTLHGPAR